MFHFCTTRKLQQIRCFLPFLRGVDVAKWNEYANTYVCVQGVKNVSFSENFAYLVNE